ncbi:hypothetical protein [Microvirga sp. BSC39]|jgi:hypothetical protein|uniref:hypothetical protein n=1 Tax=Microvirga sp. BSC39 TaxID=1549810 RepID=UPI0004E9559C|nr:hypothetical protein [Microvirga sp. BSC39]KFG67714.1 hypothetical protein JH26_20725 [Microvirga sp. BSC39]
MSGARTLQVLLALGGMIAWAVQFTIIYGVTSTLCGRGWADATIFGIGIVPLTILTTTLATLSAAAILLAVSLREDRRLRIRPASATDSFLSHAGVLINGFSLVAILWNGVPAFILPACA